jgi:hypothetical protein
MTSTMFEIDGVEERLADLKSRRPRRRLIEVRYCHAGAFGGEQACRGTTRPRARSGNESDPSLGLDDLALPIVPSAA